MKPNNEALDLFIEVGFLNLHKETSQKINLLFIEAAVHLKDYMNKNQQYPKLFAIHFQDIKS